MTGVAMQFLFWFLTGIIVLVFLLVAWRFARLRARGTQVALRRLPVSGIHGWRIGIFRYSAGNIYYYKLRSLFPMADAIFVRSKVDIRGKRDVKDEETPFLNEDEYIMIFNHAGVDYEVQFPHRGAMAFTAWVESAPDSRMERISPKVLQARMNRARS